MRTKKNLLAVFSLITALALMMSVVFVGVFSASAATDDTITVDLSKKVKSGYSEIVDDLNDRDGDGKALKITFPASTTDWPQACSSAAITGLDPAKLYTFSYWYKGDSHSESTLWINAGAFEKLRVKEGTFYFTNSKADAWTQVVVKNIAPSTSGMISWNVSVKNTKTTAFTTYLDAVTVTEQAEVNLFNFVDDNYSSVVNEEDQDGDKLMLKLVVPAGTTTASKLASNGVTIEDLNPSKKYTVSFWKKGDTMNGSSLTVAGNDDTKKQAFSDTDAGVWKKFTLSDIEPQNDGTIVLNIQVSNGKTVESTTYIDALTVTEQGSDISDNDTSVVSTRMIKPSEFAYGNVAIAVEGGRDDGDNQQLKLSVPANEAKSSSSISITGLDPNKKYTISLWIKGDGFSNGNFGIDEATMASGGSGLKLTIPTATTADWVELKVEDVSPTSTWTVSCGFWLKNSDSQAHVLYADTITVAEQADSSSTPGTDSAIRIACVGDSITHGTSKGGVDYPTQLLGILGDGYAVGNFGVSGAAAMKSSSKPYWELDAFESSSNWNPDKVIIMLGTNDAYPTSWNAEAYVRDLTELVQHYQSLPTAPVVYIATSPTFYGDSQQATTVNTVVCKLQKQVADSLGCTLIDIHTVTQDLGELFPDNVHPNAEGYKIVAKAMAAAVTSSKSDKVTENDSSSETADSSDGEAAESSGGSVSKTSPNTGDNTISMSFVAILAMLSLATAVAMVLNRKRLAD